ncbi:ATP synthase F0 subunit B [Pseudobdellovibrio exovorus]|uniref:ATP synthase B chain n=1 Tax=Pseudobdellovibrio exovorus JSS TaxID=1184267 RepID=M4VBP8_9BACT|nr:ATP synthase F0 subunit B [Pseudobdellovibrio exovorus]AGH96827.1 ATP synthase B chain [Pseudobdellovibrio exovorus JSS]
MEILLQLGANKSAFIQFILFVVSITFLTVYVYGPFYRAYDQRLKQTKGADQVAAETQDEAKKLEAVFQVRAREINGRIQNIFENEKKQASESSAIILNKAREEVSATTEKARQDIEAQKSNAARDIQNVSQSVADEISKKLTGAV